jgi:hypothetical protein
VLTFRHRTDFTIDELGKLDSFSPLSKLVHTRDLSGVPLHPVLIKDKWDYKWAKHTAPQPLGKGREGTWEVSTPAVWDMMLPGLSIVSLILANAHTFPW